MQILNWSRLDAAERKESLRRPAVVDDDAVRAAATEIVQRVRKFGDQALIDYTNKFDGALLDNVSVGEREFDEAFQQLEDRQIEAIEAAAANVRAFHERQLPSPIRVETAPGVICERISQPIDSVGLYVPAGSAPLPSAAIMLAVPAAIAGCPQRLLCTPPQPDGKADPAVLVAARIAGVDTVFKAGGAQAIAAMAYGTESIPKVLKIFGPGNAWVTAAKSVVSIDPDGAAADMPAGPSEVLVIVDDEAEAEFAAADLLSQAEHGSDSQVVLLSTDPSMTEQVVGAVLRQLESLDRRDTTSAALTHARIINCDDLDQAVEISNDYAPEHLILQTRAPRELLGKIRNAGSVFLGPWSPESAGDYCSGTNHVLPTYGAAKTFSGLGVDQFMRQMTVQELSEDGLNGLSATILQLASMEGLDAHAQAVKLRLRDGQS